VPFIAALQTTPDGQPQYACFAQQPFTTEEVAAFAAKSLATSATVVTDGLWCFRGVKIIGAEHERFVTGGGAMSPIRQDQERGHQLGDAGVLGPDERRFSYPLGIEASTLSLKARLGAPRPGAIGRHDFNRRTQ
jgi:hypothetical protein